jgi:hypothetical protein
VHSLLIEQLKKTLVDIGNRVIKANRLDMQYEEDEVSVYKAITPSDRLSRDDLRLRNEGPEPLRDESNISDYFDYINRYAFCELAHGYAPRISRCRSSSNRRFSQVSLFFMIDLFNSCAIRGLKIENLPIYEIALDSPNKQNKLSYLANSKSSCCQECSLM